MNPPNRGDLGSGGLPLTSGAPLLGSGLGPSGQTDISSAISAALGANTVFANLSYADKLRIVGGLLSKPAYNHQHSLSIYVASEDASTTKIRDHLNLTHKLAVAPYTPSPNNTFNSAWFKQLKSGLAIIPSSALLLALSQGLIALSNISCLIIDDAYLVALDDLSTPLMTIILEYYGPLITSSRPRILGLTRYPLHVGANFGYAALRMEQLLDARVFGQLDARRAALKRAIDRLTVSVLDYPVLQPCTNPAAPPAGQYHVAARATLYEIGACCYPLLAYFSVDSVLESMTPKNMFSGLPAPNFSSGTSSKLDNFLQFIQAVSQTRNYRCIVIGTNPFTVLALGWILSAHQRPGVHSSVYLGQLGQEGATNAQRKTLNMFKAGSINTLVCTDAILSDIDGGICTHVLWFNPHSSLIAFAHSRLLARYSNANMVIMAEHGNREHYRAIRDILHTEPLVSDWIYSMNVDGAPIPPPSLAHSPRSGGTPIILTPSRPQSQGKLYIMDPVSGSRIYPKDATEVLYRYLASCSTNENTLTPTRLFTYSVVPKGELWSCTVNLSACSPPLQISGDPSFSKATARASACFKSCSTLFKLNLLASHMFPLRPVHTLTHGVLQCGPSPENHPVASPLFWHNCVLAAPSCVFYPLIVSFATSAGSKPRGSMILLTRLPLVGVEPFSIFTSQEESKVHLQSCASLVLPNERVKLVFRYTMHLWRTITNKPFECPSGELAYFVCPVVASGNLKSIGLANTTSVEPFISWKEMNNLDSYRVRPLNSANVVDILSDLGGGVIQDRANEFTRRFEDGQLRRDLNPLSRVMMEQEGGPTVSLLDYYTAHRHEFEGIKDLQQPIIEARLLPGLTNRLDPKETMPEIITNFLVPEMCHLSSIPATTFHTALVIPSIIWHIENVLIAKELNLTLFQGQIRDDLLMHALCSQMAGRTFNYERLEFLGDTFIKYAASAYLYGTEPNATSGALHSRRQVMVSNKTLWAGAQVIGLPTCIQSEPFRPKHWIIPNTVIMARDRIQDPEPDGPEYTEPVNIRVSTRSIPLKTVADVVEAIIGAALLSGGEKLAFSVAKTLGFDVRKTCDWPDVVSYAPSKTSKSCEAHDKEMLKGIMKIIGTTLEYPYLLLQAMHHPSLSIYSESYERLEFLGDSVLDMLVVQSFFADEEKWSPHAMTLLKSSMVSNRVLAIICVESGLHRFLLHDKPSLTQQMKTFVEGVEAGKREAQTDSQRTKHWSSLRAPKELGDVVEALLGAIYTSSGFRLTRVKAVYDRLLKPFYDRYIDKKAMLSHPMTRLMSRLESVGCRGLGVSKTIVPSKMRKGEATKCEVKVHGRILAEASAGGAKRAIILATEEANLRLDLKFNDVMKGCTCKDGMQGKKRKRVPTEEGEIAEVDGLLQSDGTLGDDAEHPIDVDMFDF